MAVGSPLHAGVDRGQDLTVYGYTIRNKDFEAIARTILMEDKIHQEVNIYKGTAELLVVSELAPNPEQWFLLCTKRPIKAFIFQNRSKAQLIAKDNPSDDNVFFKKEFIDGVDARCNAGYGLWQFAFGSTGEADMPTKA